MDDNNVDVKEVAGGDRNSGSDEVSTNKNTTFRQQCETIKTGAIEIRT